MDYKNFDRFGRYLKQVRKNKGYTQETLGVELETTGGHVSKWETGSNFPTDEYQVKLSKVLSIPEGAFAYFDSSDAPIKSEGDVHLTENEQILLQIIRGDTSVELPLDMVPETVRSLDRIDRKVQETVKKK